MNRFIEKFHPEQADVTVCGSMAHKDLWLPVVEQLQSAGLNVHTPALNESLDWSTLSEDQIIETKNGFIERHLANIAASSATLVCNYEKNGEQGYVGANVLMEMTAAFIYDKPLYVLNDVDIAGKGREIRALKATILNGDVNKFIEIIKEKK